MSAGQLRDRVAFHRLNAVTDDYGGVTSGYAATPFLTVWGRLQPEKGAERVEAGRLQAELGAVLTIRWSRAAATITTADQARIGGELWQIRSVVDRGRRRRWLELAVERGGAQG